MAPRIAQRKKELLINVALPENQLRELISAGLQAGRHRYKFPADGALIDSVIEQISLTVRLDPDALNGKIPRNALAQAIVDGVKNSGVYQGEIEKDYFGVQAAMDNIKNASKSRSRG